MDETIANFDDTTAIRVLDTIAKHTPLPDEAPPQLDADLKSALEETTGITPAAGQVSDGDMARQALMLLAEDPKTRRRIIQVAENPPRGFIEPALAIALTGGLIMVLKTKFDLKRNEEGRWTFSATSAPLDKDLLKDFVSKLLSWIPSGPFK
jgi:hypothetical protein